MLTYTRKGDIKPLLAKTLQTYQSDGLQAFSNEFHALILAHRVKFPLLEFCAKEVYKDLTSVDQIKFCDEVSHRKTEGGNVIIGILLQCRLGIHFNDSLKNARNYIAAGGQWYVSDLIGERVFGVALLTDFEKAFTVIKKLSTDESNWVVRSLGAGSHYAIKKGLEKAKVDPLFQFLISMTGTSDKEIRQGVGWAAKTTAKFYPDIIQKHQIAIHHVDVPNWFRSKIAIGLNRNQYAKRKRG